MNDHNERDGSNTSYYDVFGLSRSASDEEIKSAFDEQTKEYHPDQSDHPEATALTADINQAKDTLLNGSRTTHPGNGQSLNYVWRDGTPVHPTEDGPDSSTSAGGGDEADNGDGDQSDDDEGSDDDDPWVTDDDVEDSDPDPDPDDVNIGGDETDDVDPGGDETDGMDPGGNETDDVGIGGDETDEPTADQNWTTRREILAMVGLGGGGLLLANQLGLFGSSEDEADSTGDEADSPGDDGDSTGDGQSVGSEEFVAVGPDESLQEAIDTVVPGGTVELEPGSYFESVTVDRSLTIDAPDGATLDGNETDGDAAIRIDAPNVTVRGVKILEYDDVGVRTDGFKTSISLVNLEVSDTGGSGIDVAGESVTLHSTTVQDCGDTGIRVRSTPEGSVEIENALVERSERVVSYGDVEAEGRGITVVGGTDITVADSEFRDNGNQNLRLEAGDARGQSVEITNSTALASGGGSNILIQGTGRGDEVLVEGVVTENGSRRGVYIGSEEGVDSVTIRDVEARDNGDTGIRVRSTPEGSVEIENALVERSERVVSYGDVEAEGRGITVVGGTDITVADSEFRDNGNQNLRVEAGEVRGQSVEITNSTALVSGSSSNILIQGTGRGDEALVEGVVTENGGQRGVYIGFEEGIDSVTIRDVEARDNGNTGILVRSTPEGTVEIENALVERSDRVVSYGDVEAEGRGINIIGGSDVTVTDSELQDNGDDNLRVAKGDVRGQSVEITNSIASNSTNDCGIIIQGTDGQDNTEIHNVEANANSEYGLDLGGDSITITQTTAEDNEAGAYNFRDIDRENATIRNSTDE